MSAAADKLNKGPLDLIDEAFHLLRRLPVGVLMFYYLGGIPFVVVFLFFWADMSHGALAGQRVGEAALGMAIAYLWMKFWHAFFAARVREWITGEERMRWTAGRAWHVFSIQAFMQPIGLILKPLSLIVPFLFLVPVLSFFAVVTAEGTRHASASRLCARALSQSFDNVRQVYQVVLLLFLFGVFLFLNFVTLLVAVPYVLQVLFAIDTDFMRAGWSAGNSTFLISALALSYLALDPLLKAVFILRSYYWDARSTGEDLRVELHRTKRPASSSGAVTLVLLLSVLIGGLLLPGPLMAAEGEPASERMETSISADELDRQIDRVLSQREFSWRLPNPPVEDEEETGLFRRMLDVALEQIKAIWAAAGRAVGKFVGWLLEVFLSGDSAPAPDRSPRDWAQGFQIVIICLGAVLLGLVGAILWQAWKKRPRKGSSATSSPLQPKPDIEDENLTAAALPVDEWSRMAADYKTKGEFRLALRAYYFASLAALADSKLVVLARAKSNCEYKEEISRRAHDQPSRIDAFRSNCDIYEQAWYGMYPVDGDILSRFEVNQERIKEDETIVAH